MDTMDPPAEDLLDESCELSDDELETIAGGLFDVTVPVVLQLNLAVLSGGLMQGNLAGLGLGR
jgi:bacteriocin-like protein